MSIIRARVQALPMAFGAWYTLTYQVTPLSVVIEATPIGGTEIDCQAHYYDEGGALREPRFPGIIQFTTGNYAHNIRVRFRGNPLGTAVDVVAELRPASRQRTHGAMELIARPVSQWTPDDLRTVMLDRVGRPSWDPMHERLAELERQWFRQTTSRSV